MIRDIVFEEHYARKVNIHIQNSFNQGRNQGMVDVLNIINYFVENEIPVTPETVMTFLEQTRRTEQEVGRAPEKKCDEIESSSGEAHVCQLEAPAEDLPNKPKFEIVK